MTLKVWIHGIKGRMGEELHTIIRENSQKWDLVGGGTQDSFFNAQENAFEPVSEHILTLLKMSQLLIDFSTPSGNRNLYEHLQKGEIRECAVLIGTTGLSDPQKSDWEDLAKQKNLRLLIAPNTSLGVILCLKASELLAQALSPLNFDIEIVETHHRRKIDAPSGTAKLLGEGMAEKIGKHLVYGRDGKRRHSEIGIASLRGGSVFGEHEVCFLGDHEELRISHRALSRSLFAHGALHLANWLVKCQPGTYKITDIPIETLVQQIIPKK